MLFYNISKDQHQPSKQAANTLPIFNDFDVIFLSRY